MKQIRCSVCKNNFLTTYDVSYNHQYQMVNCLHCDSMLFIQFMWQNDVAKPYEDYSKLEQYGIFFSMDDA